jgi:hypothetical protein
MWRDVPGAALDSRSVAGAGWLLVCFFTSFLAISFACQCFFHATLFARLQVEGVTLNFLDDVFLLYLSLEAA